ncbi:MAG: hypothetical protein HYY24_10195 [Verrucomicrobia bacterium]|nr:hypothetical protein [Verrucomicrobiota bacterium]
MPIPALDENGFLPLGVHECTLEEVARRFGAFQDSDRRPRLFGQFRLFLAEARASGLVLAVIIDGSFVTSKPAPGDIDLVLVVRPDYDYLADISPGQYNVVTRSRVRRHFGFDVLLARDGQEEYGAAIRFYQQVREDPDRFKGILRITL